MAKRRRLGPVTVDDLPPDLERKSAATGYEKGPFKAATESKSPPIAGIAQDAAATSALQDMADHIAAARESGRLVIDVPLGQIDLGYLVRDRVHADQAELESLIASIRARGQQVPIEVARLGPDSYGLISGFRRILALRRLHEETGDEQFAQVKCLIRTPNEAADAYLAMVEENEIRVGLSYYERARIAARAVDQGVFETEKAALLGLYHAASRARRSKIGSFLKIVHLLEFDLKFPEAISERTGLALVKALDDRDPDDLRRALARADLPDASAEQQVLTDFIKGRAAAPQSAQSRKTPPVVLSEGLRVHDHADGSITLHGSKVAALREDLLAWLATRS